MKWTPKDITMYQQAKEYVDSVVLCAVPLSFDDQMVQSAVMNECISGLNYELEKQFKGRILFVPPLVYLAETANKLELMQPLTSTLREKGFKHIFLLTPDHEWRKVEQELDVKLMLIPLLDEGMEDGQVRQQAKEQAQLIGENFMESWNNELKN